MTKEQLEALGLNEEQIKEVFRLNGIAVNNAKGDLETKESEITNLKGQLKIANKEIEDFKELDIEEIKKRADDYKEKFEKAEKDSKEEIDKLKYEFGLNEYLTGFKFSNERVKKSIIDDLKEKNFKFEDGKFIGADDYMKELQKNEPESFGKEETKKPVFNGFKPGEGGGDDDSDPTDIGLQFAKHRNEGSKTKDSLWD